MDVTNQMLSFSPQDLKKHCPRSPLKKEELIH